MAQNWSNWQKTMEALCIAKELEGQLIKKPSYWSVALYFHLRVADVGSPSSLFGQQSLRNLQFFELSCLVILNFQCQCKAFRFLF